MVVGMDVYSETLPCHDNLLGHSSTVHRTLEKSSLAWVLSAHLTTYYRWVCIEPQGRPHDLILDKKETIPDVLSLL